MFYLLRSIQVEVQETACPFLPFPSNHNIQNQLVDITGGHGITKKPWRTLKNSTTTETNIEDEKMKKKKGRVFLEGLGRPDV